MSSTRKVSLTEGYLEDIADAIREVNGTDTEYTPAQMAAAIEATKKTLVSKSVTANGEYDPDDDDADGYSGVTVAVPNVYTAADEGKVVQSGALVEQGYLYIMENGPIDTTTYKSVTIAVPNSYTQADEGKVVSGGALVAQTAHAEITENGTYDITRNNSVTVNVSGGGGGGFPYDNPIGTFELANLGLTWEGSAGEATT